MAQGERGRRESAEDRVTYIMCLIIIFSQRNFLMLPLIVTSPTKSTIWIQLHKLHLKSNWAYGVKRIDILVFLSTHIDNCNRDNAYSLGIALDTKLIGLERTHRDFISCATAVGDISPDPNIRISDDDDDFLCALDSHLHALYATLEITAEFNKAFNHELPRGFRRQAKKYELFSFDNNPWLKEFYDLRTELTHYNTGRGISL